MGYPIRTGARTTPQQKGQQASAEALTGFGGAAPEKKAITREDAGALGAVRLLSAKVTAAPTAAEHNALVEDLRAIAALLNTMGSNFTGL